MTVNDCHCWLDCDRGKIYVTVTQHFPVNRGQRRSGRGHWNGGIVESSWLYKKLHRAIQQIFIAIRCNLRCNGEWDGMEWSLVDAIWLIHSGIRLPSHITRLFVFLLAFPDCCHFVSLSAPWEWVPKWIISVLFDSCARHVFGGGFYLEMVVPGTRFKGGFNVVATKVYSVTESSILLVTVVIRLIVSCTFFCLQRTNWYVPWTVVNWQGLVWNWIPR